jgi:hypothetical protein
VPAHPVSVSLETSSDGSVWTELVAEVELRDGGEATATATLEPAHELHVRWQLEPDETTSHYWLCVRCEP